jgi:hypothetical protein
MQIVGTHRILTSASGSLLGDSRLGNGLRDLHQTQDFVMTIPHILHSSSFIFSRLVLLLYIIRTTLMNSGAVCHLTLLFTSLSPALHSL